MSLRETGGVPSTLSGSAEGHSGHKTAARRLPLQKVPQFEESFSSTIKRA